MKIPKLPVDPAALEDLAASSEVLASSLRTLAKIARQNQETLEEYERLIAAFGDADNSPSTDNDLPPAVH